MKKNLITALMFAAAITLWLLSGVLFKAPPQPVATASDQQQPANEATKVRVREFIAQPHTQTLTLRGKTASKRSANISAEISARVVARPVERGDKVKSGDLLCGLAEDDRAAGTREAEARLKEAEIEFDGAKQLAERGLLADSTIARLGAQLESARANLARAQLNLERTQIKAPFDGIVENIWLSVGDLAQVGSRCVTLLDLDPLLIVANVSEQDISLVREGQPVSAQTSNGSWLEGIVTFVGSQSDDRTRTYPVEVTVDNPDYKVRAGLTSIITVAGSAVMAQRVSPALLTLNDEGELGLRAVDADNKVVFYAASIIEDTPEGAWVTGLPDRVRLITVGQEFVAAGQSVAPVQDIAGD